MGITPLFGIAAITGMMVGVKMFFYTQQKQRTKSKTITKTPFPAKESHAPPLNEKSDEQELVLSEETVVSDLIFISHHTINKGWVECLVRNLTHIGYRVLLDIWENESYQKLKIDDVISNSNCHKAILVATPETIESGWAREEYQWMLNRQYHDPEFIFIPIVFGVALSDIPFISDHEVINFSTENYSEAFYRLVSHFEPKSFNADDLESPPQIAAPLTLSSNTYAYIEMLFSQFEHSSPPPLILLAQMDYIQVQKIESVLAQAKTRYQPDQCLHITLPYNTDIQNYFSGLAQQCGFDETINNSVEFEKALQTRFDTTYPLFLLVSRFENGTNSAQQQIAGLCRSLNETYPNQVHLIVCGGEQLAKFKYQQGKNALLNIAQDYRWPELERTDVYAMRDNCCQTLTLDDESANELLALSGGHPILLQKCLQLYQTDPELPWQDYPVTLSTEPSLQQLFTPFMQNTTEMQQVREWLVQEDIAPSLFLFSYGHKRNDVLRRLYWKNLLAERDVNGYKTLCWRCKAMRLAGKNIL
ncbi:toll/interleukin-1 receptor domain-containing protein [Candidatus Parabeggiatoa sp. HSG14]|uniref:toll/interleukin-1 receptor domain-containing protein n=1 Tax=Candidatus Parabeggiatoa sp. HSG14 TaxID=3055593 RepID=UPI0025A6ACAB|nr:toll/interleukin-1 receptor domain-containing protein [Thiotrichales bacterium HSG14]